MNNAPEGLKMEIDGPHVKRITIAGKEIPLTLLAEVDIKFTPVECPQAVLTYNAITVDIKNSQ